MSASNILVQLLVFPFDQPDDSLKVWLSQLEKQLKYALDYLARYKDDDVFPTIQEMNAQSFVPEFSEDLFIEFCIVNHQLVCTLLSLDYMDGHAQLSKAKKGRQQVDANMLYPYKGRSVRIVDEVAVEIVSQSIPNLYKLLCESHALVCELGRKATLLLI